MPAIELRKDLTVSEGDVGCVITLIKKWRGRQSTGTGCGLPSKQPVSIHGADHVEGAPFATP